MTDAASPASAPARRPRHMARLFDYLLDGEPFIYLDFRNGLLEATPFGDIMRARPEDKIVYVESRGYRDYIARRDAGRSGA